METGLRAGEFRQDMRNQREATGLIDLLAAIVIAIFGMFLSELGIETDNLLSTVLGYIIQFSAAGYITIKFLNELRDFIKSFRKKDRGNTSK